MKKQILFPHNFRWIGWIILIPAAVIGILNIYFDVEFGILDIRPPNTKGMFDTGLNLTATLAGVMCIIGAILVAFAKEKEEDEYIAKVRLDSLLWATYINYAILVVCFLIFYETRFLYVMIFNMFTILIFFIIRFNYVLYKTRKGLQDEK